MLTFQNLHEQMTPAYTAEQTAAELTMVVDRIQADTTELRSDLAGIRSQLNVLGESVRAAATEQRRNSAAIRSQLSALDDLVRAAAKGPLNEVASLKQQIAELEASNKVVVQANATLTDENYKLAVAKDRAENLVALLKQMKGGPSAVLDMPIVRQATPSTTVAQDDAEPIPEVP